MWNTLKCEIVTRVEKLHPVALLSDLSTTTYHRIKKLVKRDF